MVPGYWLTEGGQSATGALLDHIIENHIAASLLANRAASQCMLTCCAKSCIQSTLTGIYSICVNRGSVLHELFSGL